jgi:DNA-binding PadR family transcriptional regulator
VAALSPAAVLVLGLLHEGPQHPYELYRTLRARGESRLARLSAGSLYRGMERLESDGFVEVVGTDRDGRRPERTTYRLTDAGRSAFVGQVAHLLHDETPALPEIDVALAVVHRLPADDARRALTAWRDRIAADLDLMRDVRRCLDARHLPRRFQLDVEHDVVVAAAELAWLDGVLDDDGLGLGEPFPDDVTRTCGDPDCRFHQH